MAASYCTYGHNKAAMPFSEIDLAIGDFSTKLNFMIISIHRFYRGLNFL